MVKTVLVTGASSGIGKATVLLLLNKSGYKVYAAARRLEKMYDLKEKGAIPVWLDVTNSKSIESLVERINSEAGGIDILINNAGYGSLGSVEDVSIDEAKRQFEVNIFGLARLVQAVIPKMREKGFGKIINISSIGAKFSIPLGGWYHSSKHALEGLTNSLRQEVKEFGIKVILIEPGPIISEWSTIATENMLKNSVEGSYKEMAKIMSGNFRLMYSEKHTSKSTDVAKVILKAIEAKNSKVRYIAGRYSRLILFVRSIVCDKLFDRLTEIMTKESTILKFLHKRFEKNRMSGINNLKK